jgi:hypothetical protein
MRYVFVDPSGSFNEGKGKTGIAVMHDDDWNNISVKDFKASDYSTRYEYWKAIIDYITLGRSVYKYETKVIIESFTIRANGFLIGKMPETILLIGAICFELDKWRIPYTFQTPSQAKTRFKDEVLVNHIPDLERKSNGRYYLKGNMVNDHIRDALRHLLFYKKYKETKDA